MGGPRSAGREKLSVDLLMVRDRVTGRFVYTEQLERRREAQVRDRFKGETLQVIVGWDAGSVEEFLESYPEYGPVQKADGEPGDGQLGQDMVEQ